MRPQLPSLKWQHGFERRRMRGAIRHHLDVGALAPGHSKACCSHGKLPMKITQPRQRISQTSINEFIMILQVYHDVRYPWDLQPISQIFPRLGGVFPWETGRCCHFFRYSFRCPRAMAKVKLPASSSTGEASNLRRTGGCCLFFVSKILVHNCLFVYSYFFNAHLNQNISPIPYVPPIPYEWKATNIQILTKGEPNETLRPTLRCCRFHGRLGTPRRFGPLGLGTHAAHGFIF